MAIGAVLNQVDQPLPPTSGSSTFPPTWLHRGRSAYPLGPVFPGMGKESLTILIGHPKASPRVGPLYGLPTARDVTTPAFEATFMAEADPALSRLEAFRGTHIKTAAHFALEANILLEPNVRLRVNLVLVERQPLLYGHEAHNALLAAKASFSSVQMETLPFISSLTSCHTVFLGLPSTLKIFSARPQTSSG